MTIEDLPPMSVQTTIPDRGAGVKALRSDKQLQDELLSITSPPGLASILIPCCGQLEYTKLCVPSLLKHTRQPYELIFLDIGSLDGTAEYLAGVAAATNVSVKILRTPTDLGIAQTVQDAIKQARGEYLVLLNNDTIVTDSWLAQMVALAKLSPTIGMIGPMSNYAAPPQLVEGVPYRIGPKKSPRMPSSPASSEWSIDVSGVEAFALKLREEQRGKWVKTERLGGFCLLVKQSVLERIGPLSQWSDLGLFDTDILSTKARQAGFTLACCCDLFIHHFGTRTFAHGAPHSESDKTKI
jgi:O-antigen biosynthesis protein